MTMIDIPKGLETRICVLGKGVLREVPALAREHWPGLKPLLVADGNTWKAAGAAVHEILREASIEQEEPFIFPASPTLHADYAHVPELARRLRGTFPVAVGSGTINDLVKRASFEAGTPGYLCVATACSVDGYTSYGAALVVEGFKKTVPCPAPLGILADSDVLATAPMDMTASGYADLCAKVVAGADWHIADVLGETPIDERAWGMVQKKLGSWIGAPERLAAGDREALAGLFEGLAASGFAMQYYRESRPASGAEHLYSHVWEMDGLEHDGASPSHGFKVALGTLMSTRLMEMAFAMDAAEAARVCGSMPGTTVEERSRQIDGELKNSAIYDAVKEVCLGKLLIGNDLRQRRRQIAEHWDEMRGRVLRQILPLGEMRRRFQVMGCPVSPCQIGLDRTELLRGIEVAAMIRRRYTILDLLFEMGLLDRMAARLVDEMTCQEFGESNEKTIYNR